MTTLKVERTDILDNVLFRFPQNVDWTVRHAVEGVQIFGGIGSGKSSGSGYQIAKKYLEKGFGGLVLTVKDDEVKTWKDYCKNTGRSNDLIIVEPQGKHRFDFLSYEMNRKDRGKGLTANIVQLFRTVIDAERMIASGERNSERFWDDAMDIYLNSVIDLCILAYDKDISIDKIHNAATSIPRNMDGLFEKKAYEKSLFADIMTRTIRGKYHKMGTKKQELYRRLEKYFLDRHMELSEKTRSIIEYSLDSFLFPLTREPFYSLFCGGESTFTPEDCFTKNTIILLNLPVKIYDKVGRDIQIMFKYVWQTAMERRDVDKNPNPVFLWADEAQNFIHEHDMAFQSTARSARVCTVYITQNLPNYISNMGGNNNRSYVDSFLGTLGTKIFHSNSDTVTNEYASKLFGNVFISFYTDGSSYGKEFTISETEKIENRPYVSPEEFILLKTGAEENEFIVEAFVHLHRRQTGQDTRYTPQLLVKFKQPQQSHT